MKIVVAQMGARRDYAVPSFFAKAGWLERFYTDICGDVGFGKILSKGRKLPGVGTHITRLAGRQLPTELHSLTYTFALPKLRWALRNTYLKSSNFCRCKY